MMNKFLRFDTFKEANRKATEIFEKEKINVYIFEYRDLVNPNHPYYFVTTNENIAHTDDKTVELIKRFNLENRTDMIFGNELFGGLQLIKQKIFEDERGYFTETFNKKRYNDILYDVNFVQDNESCSKKFVIRGLHYQRGEHSQGKLVRVIKGAVIDFVIDYRRYCPHYGKMLFVYLTPGTQFYIPAGFAHGFISLEDDTIFAYKCTSAYNKESEAGFNILDENLGIIDKISRFLSETKYRNEFSKDKLIFSEKDLNLPNFSEMNRV